MSLAPGLPQRVALVLPGLWAGVLLCVAFIATPAPFATLVSADAGRVVARIFAVEAPLSLALGVLLVLLERRVASQQEDALARPAWTAELALPLAAIFCTVAGYYALQPMMAAARAGEGALSFGQLHAISLALFGLKMLLVLTLAWRASRASR